MSGADSQRSAPPGLHRLAHLHGVQTRYLDIAGEWRTAGPEALQAVLTALGVDVRTPARIDEATQARQAELGERSLEPASPVRLREDGEVAGVVARFRPSALEAPVECRLRTEDGRVREWKATPEVLENGAAPSGDRVRARLHLPQPLPPGYHDLEISAGGHRARTRVLAAPPTTWRPREEEEDVREWGVFLPLYALRSERSWGTGDLRDLERLLEWTGKLGGDVVGTLPLLAGAERTAEDARVYSPVSRLFWNEAYLDVESAPGLKESEEARRALESADLRDRVRELREQDLVDWSGAVAAKRAVLEPLARDFLEDGVPARMRPFVQARPEAKSYARFRAVWEARGEPWRCWPEALRDPPVEAGSGDESAFRYHLYVQWLADRQMRRLRDARGDAGPGLYLDLPLGCDPDGFDVWRHRDRFARNVAVGSPPDDFFSEGQNWGFPPLRPGAMQRSGYSYTIDALRQHMRFASRLRLDHVMGLHRLFWVPQGMSARDGVYVRYPHEDLYAILCIESHRHRTAIVGEDLGTVPREVRRAMSRHRIERMYVGQFQARPDADPFLPRPPDRSVASLNTHDTATFAGFWSGADLDDRVETGLLAPDAATDEAAERERLRSGWIRFLQETGDLEAGAGVDAPDSVLRASLRHLARTRASLLQVNLEDLWLEERPQNVPGTGAELPNFRRKASRTLEEITARDEVDEPLREVNRLRRPGDEPVCENARPATTEATSEEPAMTPSTTDVRVDTDVSLLTDDDLHLFNEGSHFRLHRKLGAHRIEHEGVGGTYFAVWAPNARAVHVIGDFNDWDKEAHPMSPRVESGIWEGFLPGVEKGARYKYHIRSRRGDYRVDKVDPFGIRHETPPRQASVVWDLEYDWSDAQWMEERGAKIDADAPVSIYEMHPGSWRRVPDEDDRPLTYRELAPELADYLDRMGFTHVELLPVMEHPFYGSWGYQTTGYFAPTSRYGTPQDFMYLVDYLHQAGFGVILDWVPSHFPNDEHGLAFFDGTHLYEHSDPREGFHPEWKSHIFNYGRHEVRSFLISSALFWLERYHADGLRVDAVASMLYRDYAREDGEWIPNEHGGRENLEAIDFLRRLNEEVYASHPDVATIAEESTAWPMVSRPTYLGGLGFGMKWDMGWMHDTLDYMSKEPVHRSFHHDELTFRRIYAFSENFVLPLSHDEVVHGKGSLLEKMPGDDWQKFANLRLLLAYQTAQPAKKLLFMGGELGQRREWDHDESLDWHLLDEAPHAGLQRFVADMNRTYRDEPALHELDFEDAGFEWIDANDSGNSVLSFLRRGESDADLVAVVFNFTPVPRENYRVGVPRRGRWTELLNTDAEAYGGSGRGNLGAVEATPVPFHGRPHSLVLSLPPLGAVFLKAPAPEPGVRKARTEAPEAAEGSE